MPKCSPHTIMNAKQEGVIWNCKDHIHSMNNLKTANVPLCFDSLHTLNFDILVVGKLSASAAMDLGAP